MSFPHGLLRFCVGSRVIIIDQSNSLNFTKLFKSYSNADIIQTDSIS